MVKFVKSTVKCYKKKTKKTVGGQKKTYAYNQYLVPLKTSDNLECTTDVIIIPKSDLGDLIDDEGQFKDFKGEEKEYKKLIVEYESELRELEWKHSELSKTYKNLFQKHNKSRRKWKELEEKINTLEDEKSRLIKALREERKANEDLKTDYENKIKTMTSPEKLKGVTGREGGEEVVDGVSIEGRSVEEGSTDSDKADQDKGTWKPFRGLFSKKESEEDDGD